MSNSTYYKEQYKSNKKKARKYKDDLKDLEKIYSNLVDEMGDEIDSINK